MSKEFKIDEEYLDQLLSHCSRSCVGKCMKRWDILIDSDSVKSSVKELIYESWRDFKELLRSHQHGLNVTTFKFKTMPHKEKKPLTK